MIVKINDVKSYDGFERHVEGTIELIGVYGKIVHDDNVYEFYLDTYDGFTSIHFKDVANDINLEDEDDCQQIGLTEDEGIEIYDEILDFVNDNGYSFIGEDFE